MGWRFPFVKKAVCKSNETRGFSSFICSPYGVLVNSIQLICSYAFRPVDARNVVL